MTIQMEALDRRPADTREASGPFERSTVEAFYARQFDLLDRGEVDEWAQTFAPEASFTTPSASAEGRAVIAAATQKGVDARQAASLTHRHLPTALVVLPDGAEAVARSYVLVVESGPDGTHVHVSSVCTDRLVQVDGRLMVASRSIAVDGR